MRKPITQGTGNQLSTGTTLKQSQQLTLTPQIQQSLHVLQLNQQGLEQAVANIIDSNVMLELTNQPSDFEADNDAWDNDAWNNDIRDSDTRDHDTMLSDAHSEPVDLQNDAILDSLPAELDIDANWQDLYDDHPADNFSQTSSATSTEDSHFHDDWVAASVSFDSRLESAVALAPLDNSQQKIASLILANLDSRYFLSQSASALANMSGYSEAAIQTVIEIIKHLDPPGVASQTIAECLLAQLHSLPDCNEAVINAHEMLTQYYDYIEVKPTLIQQRLAISAAEYQTALDLIRTLQPYPNSVETATADTIKPDVYVHRRLGVYFATTNPDVRFDLGINATYAALTNTAKGDEKHFITAQLQEANTFLQALDKRYHTILRVANAIVAVQQRYFIDGPSALKPLTMQAIAEQLNINESTVSRAVNGKYLSFSQQLIEMRTFFTQDLLRHQPPHHQPPHQQNINAADPDTAGMSANQIKAKIKQLIETEPSEKPLSDAKIEKILKEQQIDIARRTIAKYRESLGIPSASERKRKI
ncbi:RNA polymerase factor sigma-54 [Ostreibacterium oceani]|uniref:RNA polymerase sigma-54 factor n=1 Tax=Ostreibacterium oceani TaxID=2654998 RepID=A0A6N7EVG5_9GAMM|nr:RNA polymerase factor sigma-54 [Ostreibacterium oceani]MPV86541.1 RNA polymerase factor sigma-54 [Ostreibacterium oceani]